jgi:CRP-like cAMP-binding protein
MIQDDTAMEPPLRRLPPALTQRARIRELEAGEHLFRQGDKANAIFEIVRGRLLMVRQTIEGRTVVLHTARSGELFAEAALFAPTYHCDAVAAADTRVRVHLTQDLLAAFRADRELALHFMAVLAHEVQALRARIEIRNIRSARERLFQHLTLAAGSGDHTLRLDGTLKDLAAEIGLTPEALYRAIAALEREGLLARKGDRILLRDVEAT